jgi:hypothetical protein
MVQIQTARLNAAGVLLHRPGLVLIVRSTSACGEDARQEHKHSNHLKQREACGRWVDGRHRGPTMSTSNFGGGRWPTDDYGTRACIVTVAPAIVPGGGCLSLQGLCGWFVQCVCAICAACEHVCMHSTFIAFAFLLPLNV